MSSRRLCYNLLVILKQKNGESLWVSKIPRRSEGYKLCCRSCIIFQLKSQSARGASHHSAPIGSRPTIGNTFLTLPTQWMSSPLGKWERGIGPRLRLNVFVFGVNKRIRRQDEFKIPLCNSTGGNLLRQSSQMSSVELLSINSQRSKHVDHSPKEAPPQTSDRILYANPATGVVRVGGIQVHTWNLWPQAGAPRSSWGSITLLEIFLLVTWQSRLWSFDWEWPEWKRSDSCNSQICLMEEGRRAVWFIVCGAPLDDWATEGYVDPSFE